VIFPNLQGDGKHRPYPLATLHANAWRVGATLAIALTSMLAIALTSMLAIALTSMLAIALTSMLATALT
jgi:hypothetical protein